MKKMLACLPGEMSHCPVGVSETSQNFVNAGSPQFPATRWTVVLNAARESSPGAAEALARFCHAYRYPLYAFIRRRENCSHEDAEDLTQEFFFQLLEKEYLKGITIEGGTFRAYLLTLLKHFLVNERNRQCAKKRGGGKPHLSLDYKDAETRYACEPAENSTPETLFERSCAITLLDRVRDRLRADYVDRGAGHRFEALQVHLSGAERLVPYAELAERLSMSEGAVKKAVHDMRQRFGSLLRAEIAATVSSLQEVDEEIQNLKAVMAR